MQEGMHGASPTSMSANSLGVKLLCLVTLFNGRGRAGLRSSGGGVCVGEMQRAMSTTSHGVCCPGDVGDVWG